MNESGPMRSPQDHRGNRDNAYLASPRVLFLAREQTSPREARRQEEMDNDPSLRPAVLVERCFREMRASSLLCHLC